MTKIKEHEDQQKKASVQRSLEIKSFCPLDRQASPAVRVFVVFILFTVSPTAMCRSAESSFSLWIESRAMASIISSRSTAPAPVCPLSTLFVARRSRTASQPTLEAALRRW